MSFASLPFVGLVTAGVVLYYLVPKRAQWVVLLLASMVFYLVGGVKSAVWLVLVAGLTWLAGLLLEKQNARPAPDKAAKTAVRRAKKRICAACLVLCFGLLYLMKYWNFTASALPSALGDKLPRWDFVVPLGLSYFIFQSVGYVIDVYRGKLSAQKNPLKYGLFVSFFPQMVQGPISRYDQLAPQLLAERSLDWRDLKFGIQLCLWGYFKKLVIADRAAVLVNAVITENCPYGGAVIASGILFYCIQLYCDFSGGIDITRGVARMFGIDMAENFRRPIFAMSLTEYWRRWHITLGAWMRDYVFYPLSLSKAFGRLSRWARTHIRGTGGKIFATSLATFIVYLIIGIWHGANFLYCLRPVERRAHYGLAPAGADVFALEIDAAHQRQVRRMARVHDAAHDAAGVHRAVFHAFAASELCVPILEDDRAASTAVTAARRDAFVVRPCKDGFSRDRAGSGRFADA
jgi:alginate O-acetyltransferase complex protein AlgI